MLLPSCPFAAPPQLHRVPSVLRAIENRVDARPLATFAQLLSLPTLTGDEFVPEVVPSPVAPSLFRPHA